jgi:Na+/H+ antiporter NhaD/arsenite permease-like protein
MSDPQTDVVLDASLRAHPARPSSRAFVVGICVATAALAAIGVVGWSTNHAPPTAALPPLWQLGTLPFVALLLAVAVLPLVPRAAGWWHQNRNKLLVSLCAAFATLAYLAVAKSADAALVAAAHGVVDEFVPFMVLLFALFVIAGGISIEGDLLANPRTTTTFLAVGALIASFVGTTGASMLLIRPLLSTISERRYRAHTVVFFIFIVSNIGGTLLPIGDPPLFMGYVLGVPFLWTLVLWKEWLFCVVVLLVLHYAIDTWYYRREPIGALIADPLRRTPLRFTGLVNLVWLVLVILAVALVDPRHPLPGTSFTPPVFLRELLMLSFAAASWATTPRHARTANNFTFTAILEVAALFLGIFVAMQVPLKVLTSSGAELGLSTPGQFFWATGILSSFLDNAPTYLVFAGAATALEPAAGVPVLPLSDGLVIQEPLLVAVSLGAVFMGANTYIGNGPNFMVKSIAEESGVRMPSFFGYMLWSGAILIPLFLATHMLFLR